MFRGPQSLLNPLPGNSLLKRFWRSEGGAASERTGDDVGVTPIIAQQPAPQAPTDTVSEEARREAEWQSYWDQADTWETGLDELLDARRQRRAGHARMMEESFSQVEGLINALRSRGEGSPADDEEAPAEEAPPPPPPVIPFSSEELTGYSLPSLDWLRDDSGSAEEGDGGPGLEAQKSKLQEVLDNFAVDALVCDALEGPRVTQFRVRPGFGVRVESVAALDKNISLGMAVGSVRIQAPIPGEPYIGVEVPNGKTRPLTLRSALESQAWRESSAAIPLIMGMDITGRIHSCDLAKAPHMLIAGATGSGKSVCINNLVLSMLYRFHPGELELVMVDPKRVEFAMYRDIPHLIHPVVDEPRMACQALKWLVREMESRYAKMADRQVRNLAGYNQKAATEGFSPMPYIVLIIDELADLMITAKDDIETPVARLAQMSRAVGIHTILATQRPSVNVITGVIKANYPTRVAFQVSSQIDSRTILDGKGAESLQGRGDMLYSPPGLSRLIRLQSPFVDDDEILRVTDSLRDMLNPRYRVELRDDDAPGAEGAATIEGNDPLIQEALQIIVTGKRASTSFLQRRLKIGYNRAASLMEELEDRGYIGPQTGANPREILIEPEDIAR